MKLAIISDIHYGPLHQSTNHPGHIRQDSERALIALQETIKHFNQLKLDVILQLGDLIIPENHDADIEGISQIISALAESFNPVYSLLGNHDLDNILLDEYLQLTNKSTLNKGMVGNFIIGNFQFWWVNHRNKNGHDYLDEAEISVIEQGQIPEKIQCILTHYPLLAPNVTDSFYFGSNPQKAQLGATDHVRLWKDKPSLLLNGHLHFSSHIQQGRVHAITVPPFSDNLQTRGLFADHPKTYAILEINQSVIEITAYSGGFVLSRDSFNLNACDHSR